MKLHLREGLPFITIDLTYRGQHITLDKVLVDTGSTSTIFSADQLLTIGVQLEPDDTIHRIRGVGGTEFVFTKRIDRVSLGTLEVKDFEVEVGGDGVRV